MLSYQHGYHAGNFADVVKHVTLTRLIAYMLQKDKPFLYTETHSGRGLYDLHSGQAKKTDEFKQGIALLWAQRKQLPDVFDGYIHAIEELNLDNKLRYYPGSPELAITNLRRADRLVFSELHPREAGYLSELPKRGKRVFFHETDGMTQLTALLPPIERRGLIFVDPSYEVKEDYRDIPRALAEAYQRFSTGVYCLWYPLIDKRTHEQFLRRLQTIKAPQTLRIEFSLSNAPTLGMRGCGLWIINPPYTLADEMRQALTYLCTIINPGQSHFLIE